MVVEEEKLVVFLNDELLIHMDNLDLLGDKNYFTFNSDIEQGTILILDDVRYWNLEDHQMDPSREMISKTTEPTLTPESTSKQSPTSTPEGPPDFIRAYMETTPPGFEEDFTDDYLSAWGYGWSSSRGDFTLASVKRDDELRFFSYLEDFAFPSSDILNGEDFLLTFEILPHEALQSFNFEFRISDYIFNNGPPSRQITDSGYNLQLDFAGNGYNPVLLGWGEADYPTYSAEKSFYLSRSPDSFDEVMIYAKDNTIMVFLNGELIFDATDMASITGRYSRFRVEPNEVQGYILYFDNVKYWNLKWADINP
jgi:hypothetical protein